MGECGPSCIIILALSWNLLTQKHGLLMGQFTCVPPKCLTTKSFPRSPWQQQHEPWSRWGLLARLPHFLLYLLLHSSVSGEVLTLGWKTFQCPFCSKTREIELMDSCSVETGINKTLSFYQRLFSFYSLQTQTASYPEIQPAQGLLN